MKIVKNVEELKIVRIQIISKVIRWQKNHNLIKTLFTLQNYVDISSPPATNTFSFHLTTWREHSTHPIHTHFLDISFLLSPKKNNKFKASNKSFDSSKHTWRNSAPVWVYTSLNNPQSQENQSRSQNPKPKTINMLLGRRFSFQNILFKPIQRTNELFIIDYFRLGLLLKIQWPVTCSIITSKESISFFHIFHICHLQLQCIFILIKNNN